MDSRSDIEATLYAMVHHSAGTLAGNQMVLPSVDQQPNQLRSNFQLGNLFQNNPMQFSNNNQLRPRNMGESRYWRQPTTTNYNNEFNNRRSQRAVMGFNQRMEFEPNIPSGNRPRIFNSYTPYLSYSNNNQNGPTNDRNFYHNQPHNRNRGNFNNRNNNWNNNRNNQNNNRNNPYISKEQRLGKYVAKKQRVEKIKDKFELNRLNIEMPSIKTYAANIIPKETVILTSSDDDDDSEIILVPIPSPPMVCIEDSENEDETIFFATPNIPSCSGLHRNIVDRPCSPTSSIVSDDFIIQNDRSRVGTENINITEDDELQCRQPTVGSLLNNSITNNEDLIMINNDESQAADSLQTKDDDFVTPKKVTKADTSTRQTDVYESAESSDLLESIYDRLSAKTKSNSKNQNNSIPSPNNESRIKKLRKRKSSGSNKSSEHASSNDEDDEQEEENMSIINRDKTNTPYIVRGSAVESYAKNGKLASPRFKTKQKRQKFNSINQSDDDFISTLSNICCSENEKDDTPPEITAKDLIANVDISYDRRNKTTKKEIEAESMEQDIEDLSNPNTTVDDENFVAIDDNTKQDDVVVVVNDRNLDKCSKSTKKRNKISLVDECDAEIGWNTEMQNFYNESWGGENFDLTEVQSKMKGSPSLWRIRNDDKFPVAKYGRNSKMRCLNCSEIGHIRARCPQPRKKPICRMCGSQEHREPRCTNKICLKCGAPNIVFSAACNQCRFQNNSRCGVCRQKGHISQFCPDYWRRYHSTTSDHTPLQNKVEYSKVKYCPICGEKGHWAESCNSAIRFLDSPPATSRIITHSPSYPINKNATKNNPPNKNLLQASLIKESQGEVMVKLQKYVSLDKNTYYGRFVNAMEEQANEKAKTKKIRKKNNMLLNPFSKFPKPTHTENETNIESFSFSAEMEKLNSSRNDAKQSFKLDFLTPNKPAANLPSTSKSCFNDKPAVIAVIEEKSDSNYSFSEFYDRGEQQNNEPPKEISHDMQKDDLIIEEIPKKVGRNDHMVERDYISLTLNEVDQNITETPQSSSDQCVIVLNEETPKKDETCTAKIYLSKLDSQLLLSNTGQDIISSLCAKYKVVVKMEWQSRGNVLNITGLPKEQNLFHKDFVNHIQESRKEQKRKQLEQSLQVPKHKKPLIKFIDNLFSMLKINLGDVNQVFRKMTYNETLNSRNGQKMADRSRRVLNMILFGQTGLREGKEHLNALKNILDLLKCDHEDIPITNEFRNELFRHVKYIFTPFEHPNYNGAIKDYYNLKYVPTIELDKDLVPNPLAITNAVVGPSVSSAKEAFIELPEHIVESNEWSLKCKELVEQCRKLLESDECNAKIISKLDRVYDKALKEELNYLDYQALQKIIGKIQAKSKLLT